MSIVLARGPNFVYAREFVRQQHGEEIWHQLLERLPGEARPVWASRMLITESHPFTAFKSMLTALTEVVGIQAEEETARMYSFIADRSLNTIYKFFLRFAEPSYVISRYPVLWKRFFESGRVEVPLAEPGRAQLDFELPSIFLDWLRPACLGYSRKAIELSGGSSARLTDRETTQLGEDLWRISYDLAWRE